MKFNRFTLLTLATLGMAFFTSAECFARTSSHRDSSRSRTSVSRSSRPSSTKVVHRTVTTHTTQVNHIHNIGYSRPRYYHYHDCHHHHHHSMYCAHGFFFDECPHYHDDYDGGLINIDISL